MSNVVSLITESEPSNQIRRGEVTAVADDGLLQVRFAAGGVASCEVLESGSLLTSPLMVGDRVLVWCGDEVGVVLGRTGRVDPAALPANLHLKARDSLTLRCGESQVELRADGRVLVKGDDVVVRAKGTKRIRAGHVAIN